MELLLATILIVDDDPAVRVMCMTMLGSHNCVEAEQGEAAWLQFSQHHIDLVLTDLAMPVMNGVELIHLIRKVDKAIPIVVMTGSSHDDALRQQSLAYGVHLIMEKPFGLEQLVNALKPWL